MSRPPRWPPGCQQPACSGCSFSRKAARISSVSGGSPAAPRPRPGTGTTWTDRLSLSREEQERRVQRPPVVSGGGSPAGHAEAPSPGTRGLRERCELESLMSLECQRYLSWIRAFDDDRLASGFDDFLADGPQPVDHQHAE